MRIFTKIVFAAVLGFCFLPLSVKASEDRTAPQLTAYSISPSEVNTETADQEITLTVTVTDDQSGVRSDGVHLKLDPPTGNQTIHMDLALVSGDALNGVYTGTATMPHGSTPGTWTTNPLTLTDELGNYEQLDQETIEASFGTATTRVNNIATTSDSEAPQLTAYAISPSEVNTESADQEVTVTATVTDSGVGVRSDGVHLKLDAPTGNQTLHIDLSLTSGDAWNGVYSGTGTLPLGSTQGVWKAEPLTLTDELENYQQLHQEEIEASFGTEATRMNNIATTSDSAAPRVTAFELTPHQINTDTESQSVTLNITVTDNQTGVYVPGVQVKMTPLIGTQSIFFSDLTLVSGDELNGVYTQTVTFPQGSKVGIWVIDPLTLTDNISNYEQLTSDDMNTLFPGSESLTIINTAQAESVTIEKDWTLSSSLASVTFPKNTVVTKKDGGSFAFYQMVNQGYAISRLTGDGLMGIPVETIHFGIPGLNLSFSKDVSVSLNIGTGYRGKILRIQSLGEEQEAWANEGICVVTTDTETGEGTCSFTVNHATYLTANTIPERTLLVTPKQGGGPQVTTWNMDGDALASFMAYDATFRGGVVTAMGDIDGSGEQKIVTVPYSNGGPHVAVFDTQGNFVSGFFPFATGYRGGLSLVLGNVDNDVALELIVAPSTGGGPQVQVYDYANGQFTLKSQFFAYASGLRSGITVKTGDTNGDGQDEIVTTTNTGATPHVRVFSGTGQVEGQFFAFSTAFRGGVNATIADVDGDGKAEIVTTPKTAGGPQVRIFRSDGSVIASYFAYPSDWRLGLETGVGDVNGDGKMEIVTVPQNGGPQVCVFSASGQWQQQFMAYDQAFRGGVELLVGNVDGLGADEIVTAPRQNGGPNIRIFNNDGNSANFMALHPDFHGGVNIALSH